MDFLKYIILGIIEGVTEFLPISSTAHLILFSNVFKIPQTEFHKFFEIFIQSGAILSVLVLYFKNLFENKELIKKIFLSLVPTIIVGFLFYKIIKNIFFELNSLIIFSLIFISFIFLIAEYLVKKRILNLKLDLNQLTYKQAFLIGLFQSLAIVPGVSRAGAVIVPMMFFGFKREQSVLYSFFLAVPTIILAGVYDFYKSGFSTLILNFENVLYLTVGFFVSFISALIVIKWFIKYLQNHNLNLFAYYRIIIALIFYFLIVF